MRLRDKIEKYIQNELYYIWLTVFQFHYFGSNITLLLFVLMIILCEKDHY